MGVVFIIMGIVAIAIGMFAKNFTEADVITGSHGTRKTSRWSGQLLFLTIGVFLVVAGIKFLVDGEP